MKKALKIAGIVLLALLILVLGYVAYVFLDYHRIEDNLPLTAEGAAAGEVKAGTAYTVVSYNMGFGAYESDYSFFMDGGTESWAWSKERLDTNLKNIAELLKEQNADFYFVEEVDTDATTIEMRRTSCAGLSRGTAPCGDRTMTRLSCFGR